MKEKEKRGKKAKIVRSLPYLDIYIKKKSWGGGANIFFAPLPTPISIFLD